MIGISSDAPEKGKEWREYIAKNKIAWIQHLDDGGVDGRLSRLFGIEAWSTYVLLDAEGIVPERTDAVSDLTATIDKTLKLGASPQERSSRTAQREKLNHGHDPCLIASGERFEDDVNRLDFGCPR